VSVIRTQAHRVPIRTGTRSATQQLNLRRRGARVSYASTRVSTDVIQDLHRMTNHILWRSDVPIVVCPCPLAHSRGRRSRGCVAATGNISISHKLIAGAHRCSAPSENSNARASDATRVPVLVCVFINVKLTMLASTSQRLNYGSGNKPVLPMPAF
jgi:hypothetical protein